MTFAPIPDAVEAISRGDIVVVVDDEDRENEGDLIMASEFATSSGASTSRNSSLGRGIHLR